MDAYLPPPFTRKNVRVRGTPSPGTVRVVGTLTLTLTLTRAAEGKTAMAESEEPRCS